MKYTINAITSKQRVIKLTIESDDEVDVSDLAQAIYSEIDDRDHYSCFGLELLNDVGDQIKMFSSSTEDTIGLIYKDGISIVEQFKRFMSNNPLAKELDYTDNSVSYIN